ncbi:MAG: hypothetical protein V8Q57_02790 [Blautia sp.]
MIKACIFDLDGTLAYTLDSMATVGKRVLNASACQECLWKITDTTVEMAQTCWYKEPL